jgi:hypothetical protein
VLEQQPLITQHPLVGVGEAHQPPVRHGRRCPARLDLVPSGFDLVNPQIAAGAQSTMVAVRASGRTR